MTALIVHLQHDCDTYSTNVSPIHFHEQSSMDNSVHKSLFPLQMISLKWRREECI